MNNYVYGDTLFFNHSSTTYDKTVYLTTTGTAVTGQWTSPTAWQAATALHIDEEGNRRVGPETDMAWLKRRVNEMCWTPA